MRNTSDPGSLARDKERFGELFLSLGRMRGLRDPLLGECTALSSLSASQFHVLNWLGHDGPLTMGELARRVCVTEKTITGVIDRLERDAYLQRTRDVADRRVVRVALTKKGASQFRAIHEHMAARVERFLGLLDPPDREALYRILEKLRDRIAQEAPPPPPGTKETA